MANYEDLKAFIQLDDDADDAFVIACFEQAAAMVGAYIGTQTLRVPVSIMERAALEVGKELYDRRGTKNGIAQFAALDGQAVRIGRDPMAPAYPLLNRFLVVGFA